MHTEFLTLPDRVRPHRRPGRARPARSPAASARPARPRASVCALVHQRGRVRLRLHRRRRLAAHSWERAHRRLPGHGAPRHRRAALGRHPGPLRLGLPAPEGRPRSRRARHAASRTPGSSGGTTAGAASTRPTTPSPATGTSIVATGRDYNDVKPLSGIFSGSGTSRMFVDVQVTRLLGPVGSADEPPALDALPAGGAQVEPLPYGKHDDSGFFVRCARCGYETTRAPRSARRHRLPPSHPTGVTRSASDLSMLGTCRSRSTGSGTRRCSWRTGPGSSPTRC